MTTIEIKTVFLLSFGRLPKKQLVCHGVRL